MAGTNRTRRGGGVEVPKGLKWHPLVTRESRRFISGNPRDEIDRGDIPSPMQSLRAPCDSGRFSQHKEQEVPTEKEVIYDEKIYPLMAQIIEICKTHKIAMIFDCALGCDDDNITQLKCTTALLADEYKPTKEMVEAFSFIRPSPGWVPSRLSQE